MIVIPAIDILGGGVVRLDKGDYDHVSGYGDSPDEFAKRWRDAGAECIHIVDLDAAKEGRLVNLETVKKIRATVDVELEYGGGVRSVALAEELLNAGIDRVILGTAAFDDAVLTPLVEKYGERVAVSVDAHKGFVKVAGWCEDSTVTYMELCARLEERGVQKIVFTDIDRDGMLSGPNLDALMEVLKGTRMDVISSGGISSISDVEWFCQATYDNLYGVITGKALYEHKLDLEEAVRLTKGGR